MIEIKSESEVSLIQEAGRIVKAVLEEVSSAAAPGVTTGELDRKAEELIKRFNARPAFKGYKGFPGSICASVNE